MIVDTNAYKLQPSLSERVIFDGHGCHTALHLVSKLKKIKTKFLRCNGYLNSIKNPIKQDLLLILVLVRQQNFLNCKSRVLQLLKNMLPNNVKRYMRDPVKTYFGLLKIQVEF